MENNQFQWYWSNLWSRTNSPLLLRQDYSVWCLCIIKGFRHTFVMEMGIFTLFFFFFCEQRTLLPPIFQAVLYLALRTFLTHVLISTQLNSPKGTQVSWVLFLCSSLPSTIVPCKLQLPWCPGLLALSPQFQESSRHAWAPLPHSIS